MSLPVRTPRASKSTRQRRNGQNGSGTPLTRQTSSGLFGTLKSVVTAPLSWFGSGSRDESPPGEVGEKRRHHSPPDHGAQPPNAKRARHHSPPRKQGPPIGDPPQAFFPTQGTLSVTPARTRSSLSPARSSFMTRSQSLALPAQNGGLTASRSTAALDRQMSIDPPGFATRDSFSRTSQLFARGGSMTQGQLRDSPIAPPRSPSRVRATMTPQPSGATFGPLPPRKSRDPSAPPLLAGTIDSRRSPFKSTIARSSSVANFATTPSTTSNFASSASLAQSASSADLSQLPWNKKLTTGQDGNPTKPSTPQRLNAADLALQKLENYRTPLLPSRPNASSPALNHLRPKKVHVPIPMPEQLVDDWAKPSIRDKHKLDPKTARMVHPYSGDSGLKRLLARQRGEGEPTAEKKEIAIGTEPEVAVGPLPPAKKTSPVVSRKVTIMEVDDEDAPRIQPLAPSVPKERPAPAPRAQSGSLRAPKAFTKRTHQSTKNKFSAITEDDDDSLAGLPTEEELLSAKPIEFKIPEGFSFKPMPTTKPDVTMDTTSAASSAVNGASAFSFPTAPPAASTTPTAPSNFFASPPAVEKSESIPASLQASAFSSSHPKPDLDNPMDDGSAKKDSVEEKKTIPSFFPQTSTTFTPPAVNKVPNFGTSDGAKAPNLFGSSSASENKTTGASMPLFGGAAPPTTNGDSSKPSPFSAFGKPSSSTTPAASNPAPTFSFTAPPPVASTERKDEAPKPSFSFGQPAPSAASPSFSPFGATKPAESTPATEAPKLFGGFGTPAPAEKKNETAKAPGPKTPPQTDSGEMRMEESPERSTAATNPPSLSFGSGSGFSFGASAPKTDAPAPAFGGSSTPFSFGATPAASDSAKSPFGAPTPAPASTPFSFGAPAADSSKPASTTFSFGASDTSKPAGSPFSFGQSADNKPAAPASTPFSFGAPLADTSKPAASPFAFGNSTPDASKPASSPFSFGASDPSKATSPFGAPAPAATGFPFGAPKIDANAAPREGSPFSAPGSPFAAPAANPFGSPAPQSPAATNGGPTFTFGVAAPVNNPFTAAAAAPAAAGGGFGFTIGAPDPNQREKKPMPRRRTQQRR